MKTSLFAVMMILFGASAQANSPTSFVYQGKIYNASGTQPLESGSVTFTLQIRSPDGQCLLFEEKHTRNMSGTGGVFSLVVGEGTSTAKTALSLTQVIDNSVTKVGEASCSYAPIAGDSRRIRLIYNDGTADVTFPTDQQIRSVPYAMESSTLQGLGKTAFIQTSTAITQAKVESLLGYFTQLSDLANGTSTQYAKISDLPVSGGVLNMQTTGVKVADTPAAADMAVNRNYVDAKIAGRTVDLTGMTAGKTLIWNTTTSRWEAGVPTLAAADMPAPGGDMGGSYASMSVQRIQGVAVSSAAPAAGQVLAYNSITAKWEPLTPHAGTVTAVAAQAPLTVTNASTTPTLALQSGSLTGQNMVWNGSSWGAEYMNMSQLRGVASVPQFPTTCSTGQTLSYISVSDRYDCSNIAISSSQVSGLGNAATLSVGTASGTVAAGNDSRIVNAIQTSDVATSGANKVLRLDSAGKLPALDGSQLTGVIAASVAAANVSGLGGAATLNVGTAAGTVAAGNDTRIVNALQLTDVGTSGANKVLRLDANGKLPALDGSQLTGVVASSMAAANVTGLGGAATLNVGTTAGTVAAGNDTRIVNAVQSSEVATSGADKILRLDSAGKLPALDGSQLTNLPTAPFSNVVVLDSSNPVWATNGVKRVFVQVWGGGGGGGGGTGLGSGGGGGAAGGYSAGFVDVSALTTVNVTVGAAGTAGAAAGSGGAGGDSSFGGLIVATGGAGGTNAMLGTSAGGDGTIGQIKVSGGRGSAGTSAINVVGVLSLVGLGGTGGTAGGGGGAGSGGTLGSTIAGGAGNLPGGGGGGGGSGLVTGALGGAGGKGRVIIWY